MYINVVNVVSLKTITANVFGLCVRQGLQVQMIIK